jgi:hypothetical protein
LGDRPNGCTVGIEHYGSLNTKEIDTMLNRLTFARAASIPVLGFTLVAASILVAGATDIGQRRVRLGGALLDRSRGSDLGNSLGSADCDAQNGYFFCTNPGDNCISCAKATFVIVIPGGDGYDSAGLNNVCGQAFNGTCDILLDCNTAGNPTAQCTSPSVFVEL